jgi:hypothetical protein
LGIVGGTEKEEKCDVGFKPKTSVGALPYLA